MLTIEHCDVAQVVADQLKRFLNIDATTRAMESSASQAAYLAGHYQIAVQGSSHLILDPDGMFQQRYIKSGLIAIWMQWVHPRVQELFDEQVTELDREKRRALIQKADNILLHEDNAYLGLYWSMRSSVVDNRIKNFHPHPSINVQLKHEHIWCDPKC